MQVHQIILQQLGGNMFLTMTGCYQLVYDGKKNNMLQMRLRRKKSGANFLKITLNGLDLYDIEFISKRWNQKQLKMIIKTKHEFNNIYDDQLREIYESTTGQYTSL